ncbi:MAG: hypothetical protein AAF438_23295 [Pseudomonadota bacterium]
MGFNIQAFFNELLLNLDQGVSREELEQFIRAEHDYAVCCGVIEPADVSDGREVPDDDN